jgi:copper chaperone CopZ
MKTYRLSVPDMHCMHCVKTITKLLEDAHIKDFTISLEAKSITLNTDKINEIVNSLSEAGYETTIEA